MDKPVLDLYTDYLISSFGQTTATGLSALLNGSLSHDRISRFLNAETFTSAHLWRMVKPLVRQVQNEDAVLIVDDSIQAKPHTDESELNCWHWDHTVGRSVKGLNLLSVLYQTYAMSAEQAEPGVSIPVAFELITKPDIVTDPKTGRPKRKARQTKNDLYRQMLSVCHKNGLPFRYVLNDTWFASAENMLFVKHTLDKDFVMPLKENRKVSLSPPNTPNRTFAAVSSLPLEAGYPVTVWLEDVSFALLLVKQVFTNENGSQGVLYLVTSDTTLTADKFFALYQKRWKVEEYHKSLKSNLALAKSPTKTIRTQSNHVFASLMAFVKMEQLRLTTKCSHFTLKARLYRAAIATAYEQLQQIKTACLAA